MLIVFGFTKKFFVPNADVIKYIPSYNMDYPVIEKLKLEKCYRYNYKPETKTYKKEVWTCFHYNGPIGNRKYKDPRKMGICFYF